MENGESHDGDVNVNFSESITFDIENTIKVLQEALGRSTREAEGIADILMLAGVQGVRRAELLDSLELDTHFPRGRPLLEIESEDNKIYHLHLTFLTSYGFENSRFYSIDRIIDLETGVWIYNDDDICGMGQ